MLSFAKCITESGSSFTETDQLRSHLHIADSFVSDSVKKKQKKKHGQQQFSEDSLHFFSSMCFHD